MEILAYVVSVVVLAIVSVYLVPLKIEAKAWVLRRQGVSRNKIAELAMREAERERSPVIDIIRAVADLLRSLRR